MFFGVFTKLVITNATLTEFGEICLFVCNYRLHFWCRILSKSNIVWQSYGNAEPTRSHPEMVGDMSRVTLNFDLSKIPFVHF